MDLPHHPTAPSGCAATIAALGWLAAGLSLTDRLLRRLTGQRWRLYCYRFVAQAVAPAPRCGGRGAAITVQALRRQQLPAGYPRRADVLDQRDRQGAFSVTAFRDGQLSGFLWLLYGSYHEDEVRVRYHLVSPRSAWDFDVWVSPDERLGLTFARLWDEAHRLLREHAVDWSCSRISTFNPASLRAHARLGTVSLGHALFLVCGRWQWMGASLPPYLHLSRRDGAFPHLTFDTGHLIHQPSGSSHALS